MTIQDKRYDNEMKKKIDERERKAIKPNLFPMLFVVLFYVVLMVFVVLVFTLL